MTEWFGGDPIERAGEAPVFFNDPVMDRMMGMILALAEELAITRERLDSLERVLTHQGLIGKHAVDELVPDPATQRQRQEQHQQLVARLLAGVEKEMRQG